MTTETTLEQFVRERFGLIKSGAHTPESGECCVLEAINACHDRPLTDSPTMARTFDIRPLNDGPWPDDETRTRYMLRLGSLLDGSLDWPQERQQRFMKQVVRETVRQIIAELPGLGDEVRAQCRRATSMEECRAYAYAAAGYARSAAAEYARSAAAEYAANAAANAANYAAYAAADAANAAYAAANAAYAARAAYAAANAAYAASVLIKACEIWIEAAEQSARG